MPRGVASKEGDTNVARNGYHYTRTAINGWRLTHHLVAEATLGRAIREDETVSFKDGNRDNLDPNNIVVSTKKVSLRGRLAALQAKKLEIEAEIAELLVKIAKQQQRTES